MPTHFGPSLGPRQGPDGRTFECKDNPKTTSISVSFLTNSDQIKSILPENFVLLGEPVVTVSATYMKEIEWLAGRGYNTLGVSFSVQFNGERDQAKGNFLSVLWENLTDPILTGREEIGFSKIYCELPEPRVLQGTTTCQASWMGFNFMDMSVYNLNQVELQKPLSSTTKNEELTGTLHYKYIPHTGGFPSSWGKADIAYVVLTPEKTPNRIVTEMWRGEGKVLFHHARWEDLPTQYTIVNTLSQLEIIEPRGASIVKSIGGKDLSDQRILK
ncbi:hypothetical protein CMK19_14635 [Candidatus Poribacteria bacterium]|nr:hypothetical protein [Candidatus Poribacteria bacterium]